MPESSARGRTVWWQSWHASAPGRLMGIKPQQPSFVALWPEQQKGDNERSVRSSARIGCSLPPETPDVMGLECREGGRKERVWGGGRLSSPSQTESPKDKPNAFLCWAKWQNRALPKPNHSKLQSTSANTPWTKATHDYFLDTVKSLTYYKLQCLGVFLLLFSFLRKIKSSSL